MFDLLDDIFNEIDLIWCDGSSKEIIASNKLSDLFQIFPNLHNIFQEGQINDDLEYRRTLKHIFRVFKVYQLFKIGKFEHDTLSSASINKIREKVNDLDAINPKFIPLILMYHDIGRFYDKANHPEASFSIIKKKKLLDLYELSEIEKLLINKVIQYHLFFATIYTGESTFYGIYSLINNEGFIKLISYQDGKMIHLFVDLLEIFTFIDIFGYPYSQLYDHYLEYYNEINTRLKDLLNSWPNREKILKSAQQFSYEWLDFRIAGALRIFQFVKTKPYLTENFYFEKIKNSLNNLIIENEEIINWKLIKEKYLIRISKIQVKYGLPFLMILAFGNFYRASLRKSHKISPKLIFFWVMLSKEIQKRTKYEKAIWNLFFEGLPFWSELDKKFAKKLEMGVLKFIIQKARHEFNEEKKEYSIFLNFKPLFKSST